MKRLVLCFSLFYSLCFSASAQLVIDEDKFKDISNQEFIEALNAVSKYLNWMENLMSSNDTDRDISEEKIIPAFEQDSIKKIQAFNDFLNANLLIWQSMNDTESDFKISDADHFSFRFDKNLLRVDMSTLFFCDGTTEVNDEELDLTFSNKIPTRKEIDSISVDIYASYITDFEFVELNKTRKSATYDGKKIKIENIVGNQLIISYDKTLRPFLIEGLNAKKEVLDDYQYMTTDEHPEKSRKTQAEIQAELQRIINQATADSLMPQSAFQAKYLPEVKLLTEKFFLESDVKFREYYYYGTVDGVRLYFAKNRNELSERKVIKNGNPKEFFIDFPKEGEGTILYDKLGNLVYQETKDYSLLNDYFYEDDNYFYHLNLAEKTMEPVLYYSLEALDNNYVMVQRDENEPYFILNKENRLEVPNKFRKIDYKSNILYAINADNDSILFIPESGEKKWMKNITHLSGFENGYAVIRSNEKYGFIDNQVNIVIPIIYDSAEEFDSFDAYTSEDNLFIVKKGDLWGAVNKKNETIIPFIYKELKPFSHGITLAENSEGKCGLINTKNKTIVPFTANGYSISTNFGKRQYYMNGQNYDYLGRLEGVYEYQEIFEEAEMR